MYILSVENFFKIKSRALSKRGQQGEKPEAAILVGTCALSFRGLFLIGLGRHAVNFGETGSLGLRITFPLISHEGVFIHPFFGCRQMAPTY